MSKWCYAAGIVVLNELSMSVYATEVKAVTPGWHLPFAFHPAGWFWLVLTGIVGLVVGALLGTRHVRRSWRYGDSEENVRKTTLNGEDAGAFQKTCSEIGIFPFYCDKNGHLIVEGDASEFWPLRGGLPIPPEEWLIPEDLSNFKLGWDALLSGKKREILLTYRTKGETTVKHYEMRVQRIPDGGFSGIVRDITELKTGEAMVEDTAFMFRSVLDSLPGHLFIKDVEKGFRYTLMNRNDDLFFDRRSRNCVGKTDFDIFPEDKAKQMRHEDEEIVRSGKDFESIIVIPASNGNNMYMKVFKRLLVKADGTRLIIGIGMNITRERELEHELEKNIRRLNVHIRDEQNFSSCLEIVLGSDDFDFVINSFLTKLGEVSKVDRCSIFRYDEKDLSFSCTHEWSRTPELSRKERLQKVDAREYPECMEMIMRHEDIMIEDTLNPAAGFKKFARLSATSGRHSLLISGIWRKGRLLGLVSMDFAEKGNKFSSDDFRRLADAGKIFLLAYERKRRLNVIANGHAIQRQICDSLPLPVLLFDLDYNVIAINPEVTASTGLSEQDVIGKKCYKVLCNCDDVPEWCPMRTTLKEKKRVQVDYSGYGHEYIVSTQPVFNHQGELIYVLEIAQDITELKKQEQRLSMQNLLLSNAAAIAKITYIAGGANAQVNIIGGNSEIGMDKNGANSLTDWLFVDDREEFERQFRELNSGDRKEIDMMCRSTATGDMRDYRLQGTRDNKDNELYYGVLLDVTVQVAKSRERREFIKQLNGYVENERIINMVLSQIILDKNFDRNIDEVLQIIATRLNSDRAYFGVFSGKEHNCTFSREWLSDGVLSLKSVKNPQFYEFFSQWDSRFNGEELLTIPDVRNSEYAQAFSESGCRTLVCAPIWVNKELYGILGVGFIHCIREISDLELNIIRSAARLISLSRERQIQRESLEALDHQNRLILSSMPIPVCLFDRDGKLIHSNPAASTLAGKTEEEMIKHPCFESLCGFDGPPEFCPVHHVLKDGKPYVHDIEIGKRMYQVSAMPIFDLNDRIVNVIEILVDLSEIIESKRKLEIAVKAAQDADSAKSVFLATMSHEMRTPLNAVIGFSELLKTESLPLDERSEYVASINLAGNSLLKLLNDVLDLSKIEAEQMEIVPTPIGIDKILKEIVAIFQYKIQEKKLFCHLEIPDDLPILMLDELRLRQILLNVVGNAVKFTENGGVTLTVDFQRKEKNRGDLAIMIKDTGIGIAPEIQSRIFLPFVQQDSARDSRIFNGTGLGLTIAHRFAVIMGGDIKVKSEPGKGSVFTIELPGIPYELGTPGEQGKKAKKTGVTLPKMKLLLVDDVIMNLKVLQAMCKKLGMECVCANSGEEALSILRGGEKFDAVLTDLWMPKMNGTELAKQISNDESLAEVSVIAVTADTQLATTLPKDFCGALTKPITPETLSKIIEESLTSGKKKKRGGK